MSQAKQTLHIGWGVADITPDKPGVLAGQFYGRTSEYVHDPILATAMAVSSADGAEQAVMVTVDAVGVREYTWDAAIAATKEICPEVDTDAVFFNATHTHSAPSQYPTTYPMPDGVIGDKEYSDFMAGRMAEAVKAAWEARQPSRIGWGVASAAFANNRLSVYADGHAQMYGETATEDFRGFQAGEESVVQLIFTWDAKDKLTGVVVNVACPSQCTEHSKFITADYWGDVRDELRRHLGDDVVILPQCAAGGDISPHLRRHKPAEERMYRLEGLLPAEGEIDRITFEMARRKIIARRVADAVDEALPIVGKDVRDEVEFAHVRRIVDLPKRMVTKEEYDNAVEQAEFHRAEMAKYEADPDCAEYTGNLNQANRHQRVIDRYEHQAEDPVLPMEMHAIRLGDIALVTNRFELYHDYEARIQALSPAVQTFIVQLAGGGTYLPTKRAIAGAAYGSRIESNTVGFEGGDVLVEESLKAINKLFE